MATLEPKRAQVSMTDQGLGLWDVRNTRDVLCTHLCTSTGSFNTHALWTGGAGYDDDLALEGEQVLDGIGLGNRYHFDVGWYSEELNGM